MPCHHACNVAALVAVHRRLGGTHIHRAPVRMCHVVKRVTNITTLSVKQKSRPSGVLNGGKACSAFRPPDRPEYEVRIVYYIREFGRAGTGFVSKRRNISPISISRMVRGLTGA